jgi:hypothetical protein
MVYQKWTVVDDLMFTLLRMLLEVTIGQELLRAVLRAREDPDQQRGGRLDLVRDNIRGLSQGTTATWIRDAGQLK